MSDELDRELRGRAARRSPLVHGCWRHRRDAPSPCPPSAEAAGQVACCNCRSRGDFARRSPVAGRRSGSHQPGGGLTGSHDQRGIDPRRICNGLGRGPICSVLARRRHRSWRLEPRSANGIAEPAGLPLRSVMSGVRLVSKRGCPRPHGNHRSDPHRDRPGSGRRRHTPGVIRTNDLGAVDQRAGREHDRAPVPVHHLSHCPHHDAGPDDVAGALDGAPDRDGHRWDLRRVRRR